MPVKKVTFKGDNNLNKKKITISKYDTKLLN